MTSSEYRKAINLYKLGRDICSRRAFSFRLPMRYTSPRPSRRPTSSESGQLPYQQNSHTPPMSNCHANSSCRIPMRYGETVGDAEGMGRTVTQNASRPDIDYGTGGIRFYRLFDYCYRFSRRLAILFTTSSSSNPSTHPTANPATSPIEPATTHWTTACTIPAPDEIPAMDRTYSAA